MNTIEQGFNSPQFDKKSLAFQVAELERKLAILSDIAGSAIATIKINRERGTLKIDDPKGASNFDGWVEEWNRRLKEAQGE